MPAQTFDAPPFDTPRAAAPLAQSVSVSPALRHSALDSAGLNPLHRLIVTLVAAIAALAVIAASAVPARADAESDRLLKALIAIGAIGIIAHEIDRKNDRDDRRDYRPQPPRHEPQRPRPGFTRDIRIPPVCAVQIDVNPGRDTRDPRSRGRGREANVFTETCLRREGIKASQLPRNCAIDIRSQGRRDRVYSEQCLRSAGFRIGGRR